MTALADRAGQRRQMQRREWRPEPGTWLRSPILWSVIAGIAYPVIITIIAILVVQNLGKLAEKEIGPKA